MSNHHESSEGAKLYGQEPAQSLQAQAIAIVQQLNVLIKGLASTNVPHHISADLNHACHLVEDNAGLLPHVRPARHPPHHPDPASLQHQAVENLVNAFNYGGFTNPAPAQRAMVTTAVRQIVEAARHV